MPYLYIYNLCESTLRASILNICWLTVDTGLDIMGSKKIGETLSVSPEKVDVLGLLEVYHLQAPVTTPRWVMAFSLHIKELFEEVVYSVTME